MYLRRIKNVTLTIPCVVGPYNGVQCRLTLLSSMTRVHPWLTPPPHRCCCDRRPDNGYEVCACDPRVVRQYAARENIAPSGGKNDGGQFDFSFDENRYFPFEHAGAVSRWRIELPPENNYFDPDSLSDFILCLDYTAREGGKSLRRAANEIAQKHLPGDGWCFFDVRHDFPDAWNLFQSATGNQERCKSLHLAFEPHMFPEVSRYRRLQMNLRLHASSTPAVERRSSRANANGTIRPSLPPRCAWRSSRSSGGVGLSGRPPCGRRHDTKRRCPPSRMRSPGCAAACGGSRLFAPQKKTPTAENRLLISSPTSVNCSPTPPDFGQIELRRGHLRSNKGDLLALLPLRLVFYR